MTLIEFRNDIIVIDIPSRSINVKLSDEVLKGIADIHRQYPMPI